MLMDPFFLSLNNKITDSFVYQNMSEKITTTKTTDNIDVDTKIAVVQWKTNRVRSFGFFF